MQISEIVKSRECPLLAEQRTKHARN
jgi:hypothetical protein